MNDYCVYLLICTSTGKCYVGLTKAGVSKRFKAHVYNARAGKGGALYAAIRKYGPEAFTRETLLEGLTREEACEAEKALISERNTRCPNGYNVTVGGDGAVGLVCSDETRARMSETHKRRQADPALRERTSAALRGVPKREEHVRKVSLALVGKTHSPETRAKIVKALTGRKQSEETIAKRAEKLRGRKRPPELVEQLSARTRGVPKSAEHRQKLSEALTGRTLPADVRARISAATRGKPKSEEWKAKMRATLARKRERTLAC
jgi:group I intron endonuclease